MPKTKISEFSATPGNNTDIDGINIAEGCAPSGINDAIRELMAQLKDFQAGTAGDSFNGPVGTTTAAAGAFTTLSASSTVSGAGFSTYLASPPAIGGTAAAAGSFTTLSASGTLSLTGGLSSTSSAISYAVFSSSLANGGRLEIKDGANLVGYIGNGANSIGAASASEFCVNGNSRILFGIAGNSKLTLNSSSFALDSTVSMTVNSGTANGVAYLNGSKVLTTGSALTFDGTNLGAPAEVYRTTASSYLRLSGGDGVGSGANVIAFGQSHATAPGRLSLSSVGTGDIISNTISGTHIYQINGSEQMRLTSTGLGIGTSSPAAKADVVGTVRATSQTVPASGTGAELFYDATNAGLRGYNRTGSAYVNLALNDNVYVGGGSSGNVGMGTSSPGSKLTVSGDIQILSTNYLSFSNTAQQTYIRAAATNTLAFGTNSTEQMRLDSSGNLGIGTSSPASFNAAGLPLVVGSGSGNTGMTIYSGTASNGSIHFADGTTTTDSYRGIVTYSHTNNSMAFYTDATLRATLDSSGNLGLGVTPSAWWVSAKSIDVGSTASFSTYSNAANIGNNFYLNGSLASIYKTSNFATLYQQFNGAHQWFTAPSGTAGNTISFTQAMTLDASGNLGVGTTSPNTRLEVLGGTNNAEYLRVGSPVSDRALRFSSFAVNGTNNIGHLINAPGLSGTDGTLAFATNSTERARITSGGNFLVGTTATTAGARLSVTGVDSTSSNYCMYFENSSSSLLLAVQNDGRWRSGTAAASPYNYVVGATNRDLYVDNGGNIGYVSSVRSSKTNIAPVSNAEWLLQLNPVTFNFRKKDTDGNYTEEADGPLKHGLIAEEVEAINPDMCFYDDTEHGGALRGVNYSSLITPMIKLLQEQQVMINELKAKVAALEAK